MYTFDSAGYEAVVFENAWAGSEPLFALVHATVPHPPLQLNAACEFIVASDRVGTEDERAEARSRYVERMRCINDEVVAVSTTS